MQIFTLGDIANIKALAVSGSGQSILRQDLHDKESAMVCFDSKWGHTTLDVERLFCVRDHLGIDKFDPHEYKGPLFDLARLRRNGIRKWYQLLSLAIMEDAFELLRRVGLVHGEIVSLKALATSAYGMEMIERFGRSACDDGTDENQVAVKKRRVGDNSNSSIGSNEPAAP